MNRKYLIWISCLLVLIIFIFLLTTKKNNSIQFNQVVLTNNNTINNSNFPKYLDTILSVGLDMASLNGIAVILNPMSEMAKSSIPDYELKAHLREWNGVYYLFLGDIRKEDIIKVLSHEIIHIHQYYSGDLKYLDGKVYWQGDEFDLNYVEYDKRPWETDAFDREKSLSNAIESVLIN